MVDIWEEPEDKNAEQPEDIQYPLNPLSFTSPFRWENVRIYKIIIIIHYVLESLLNLILHLTTASHSGKCNNVIYSHKSTFPHYYLTAWHMA